MRSLPLMLVLFLSVISFPMRSQTLAPKVQGHYMFVWTGDLLGNGNDFLAVIDADPASTLYGRLMTSIGTDQRTMNAHHTEYVMPSSAMLFANDHDAGRTFIFDVRDALHPKIAASFTDMAGYMHPHSYLRVPNGHVLATFQHTHHHGRRKVKWAAAAAWLRLIDEGKVIRSSSSADPAFPGALLTPYSLVVLPEMDRVVSTNSSMHTENIFSGVTYQVWRLSDLKLLRTAYFELPKNHYDHVSPEEPRRGPDGAIYVQTLGCGIERITDVDKDQPSSKFVYNFPGSSCGVPTIIGHYLVQSVPVTHGLIVLDIANGEKPVEISRLKLSDTYFPHWTSWDAKTERLAVTGSPRLYLVKLNQATGAISADDAFHDAEGKPGFDFELVREWPHGWKGSGLPHGAVFSR